MKIQMYQKHPYDELSVKDIINCSNYHLRRLLKTSCKNFKMNGNVTLRKMEDCGKRKMSINQLIFMSILISGQLYDLDNEKVKGLQLRSIHEWIAKYYPYENEQNGNYQRMNSAIRHYLTLNKSFNKFKPNLKNFKGSMVWYFNDSFPFPTIPNYELYRFGLVENNFLDFNSDCSTSSQSYNENGISNGTVKTNGFLPHIETKQTYKKLNNNDIDKSLNIHSEILVNSFANHNNNYNDSAWSLCHDDLIPNDIIKPVNQSSSDMNVVESYDEHSNAFKTFTNYQKNTCKFDMNRYVTEKDDRELIKNLANMEFRQQGIFKQHEKMYKCITFDKLTDEEKEEVMKIWL
ncbi:hypothetical protein A3Q56_03964 [Intoshia linei]|uniref:Fork-head domain-containing protein n=1 Tax=Intoshia linei TaxID=1819745 RepID=A0A177B3T7_9BILA|nr:hypothetical protein A3Q56_03964 [Intoshia linei]